MVIDKPKPLTVVPQCFEKADCFKPITPGYCNVKYDCIQGKCYSQNILCPEICNSGKDDDKDGKIDCDDQDCWGDIACHCSIMSFNECAVNRCYCPPGNSPKWFIGSTGPGSNYCACV